MGIDDNATEGVMNTFLALGGSEIPSGTTEDREQPSSSGLFNRLHALSNISDYYWLLLYTKAVLCLN